MKGILCFFIGTEAELIKQFPVMLQLQEKNIPYQIIASGQNDIKHSAVLSVLGKEKVTLELSDESRIKKTAAGLLGWYAQTSAGQKKRFLEAFPHVNLPGSMMVVHGDTVSTVMGATLGVRLGMRVAHVEAGLRSHNWLNPFPEEIDRVLTSRKARIHFAPGQKAVDHLKSVKGTVIDTVHNTIADSLAFSRQFPCANPSVAELRRAPYFVFVLHRQENLARKPLVEALVDRVFAQAETMRCALILHKPTEMAFLKMNLMDRILAHPNITVLPRTEYFDFMKLLEGSQFVITDGGSNQEELSYMGKPCLILRTHTERQDGLGENALLYGGNMDAVDAFIRHFEDYQRSPITPAFSPSERIADTLRAMLQEG